MILISYEMYALAENIMWSAVWTLCVYLQVMQQSKTQLIKTEHCKVWDVYKFILLMQQAMEDTDI